MTGETALSPQALALRLAVLALGLVSTIVPLSGAEEIFRRPVPGVSIVLSLIPMGEEIRFETGKDGRFEATGLPEGTWTTTVTIATGYLQKWIDEELSQRKWTRVTSDEEVGEAAAAGRERGGGRGRRASGGAEQYAVTAKTPDS